MAKRQWWWIDPHSCVVVRGNRAVPLPLIQFAFFMALQRTPGKQRRSDEILDAVYDGVKDPPGSYVLRSLSSRVNARIKPLGLGIRGYARRSHSFYKIVDLRA